MTSGSAKGGILEVHRAYTPRAPVLHRSIATFLLVLGLAACAQTSMPDVTIGLRNPSVPLGGTSRFDEGRFAGDWKTVACLGSCTTSERYVVATDGVFLRETETQSTPYLITAPGVLRQMGGDQILVVMWVDEGFRTAAIGDADGGWAAIVNRTRRPATDRIKAATEILDFNGWDVSKLRKISG